MYFRVSIMLIVIAGLLVAGYFTASTSPGVPHALGSIPAATVQAVPGPVPFNTANPAKTPVPASPNTPAVPGPPPAATTRTAPTHPALAPFTMGAAAPLSITVPTANITSSLGQVALNPDGTIQVPTDFGQAAWYRLGPTPGELGPAVIVGHVDSRTGPAVFYQLSSIRPGQMIDVTRTDKSVAHFRVDAIEVYRRDQFPTKTVYGPINYAGLRLITCGGTYNKNAKAYEANVVVFATLVHS